MSLKISKLPFFNIALGVNKNIIIPMKLCKTNELSEEMNIYSFSNKYQEINYVRDDDSLLYEIVLDNGNSIVIDELSYFLTLNGWKKVKDIKEGYTVINKLTLINADIYGLENGKIGHQNVFKGNMMPVYIPEKNSKEFSEWLGIVSSYAEFSKKNDISITMGNEEKAMHYCTLTKKVVKITPNKIVDKRNNRQVSWSFFSKNAYDFLSLFLGKKFKIRKIPQFIIDASYDEQFSFLKGVGFKAHKERASIVYYRGLSKPIADFTANLLRHSGYQISVQNKIIKGQVYYLVRIIGVYKGFKKIEFYDKELDFIFSKKALTLVYFNNKWRKYNSISENFILNDIFYKTKISKIKFLGKRTALFLNLHNDEGLLYNQIIIAGHI